MQELSPYQQQHRLTKMPSPLEWLSFTFASGNLLAGPYFELSDYLNYIERKGPWDPRSRQPSARSQYGAGVRCLHLMISQKGLRVVASNHFCALKWRLKATCWSCMSQVGAPACSAGNRTGSLHAGDATVSDEALMGAHLSWHCELITVTLLQVFRFAKAIICLAVHMYLVQQYPADTLTSDWYYSLSIPSRYAIRSQRVSWNALKRQAVYGEVLL